MMSNPPSSLQPRQKLHKRQQSTPVAFEAVKVHMPPNPVRRQNVHRRGQSHDLARSPIRRHQHTGSAVSMNTNIGSIQGQQILREAQQQRTTRPGQQHIQPQGDTRLVQRCGRFPPPQFPHDMTMHSIMSAPQDMMQYAQFQTIQMPMSAGSQPTYSFDENIQNYFSGMQDMQDTTPTMAQPDRRMSQPDLRIQTGLRPYTPTHQIQTAHFPLTPATTPMQHQQSGQLVKSLQGSPRWRRQDENIVSPKPVSMQKSRSLQGIAEHQELHSFTDVFDAPSLPAIEASASKAEPTKQQRPTHKKVYSTSAIKNEARPLFVEISEEAPRLDEQSQPILASEQPPSSPTRPTLSPRRMSISDLNLEPGVSASIEETNVSLDDIAQFIEGPDPEDNKWICKYDGCDKRFGRKENIKSHVQTHLGDRQFRCDHCSKCFVRGHDLKRHAKIHTGTKAYTCLCGNAFARHDALTRHRQRGMCVGAFEGIVRKDIKRGRPRKHRPEMDDRIDKASRTQQSKRRAMHSQPSQIDRYASSASSCSLSSWGSPPTETMDNLSIHGGGAQSPADAYDDAMKLFGFSGQGMTMSSEAQANLRIQMGSGNFFSFTPPASPGFSTGNRPSPSYRELTPSELLSFDSTQPASLQPSNFDLLPAQVNSQSSGPMLDISIRSSQVSLPPSSTSYANSTVLDDPFRHLPSVPQAQQVVMQTTQSTSLPSLSHSSSPPPQEPNSALVFDFPEYANPLRMSTMSNISTMSFSLGKVMDSNTHMSMSGEEQERNAFDSFLDYNDDTQVGMNMGLNDGDSFFASL